MREFLSSHQWLKSHQMRFGVCGAVALCAAALLISLPFTLSQRAEAAERYQWSETDAGLARLDTQTGDIALCTVTAQQLRCEAVSVAGTTRGLRDRDQMTPGASDPAARDTGRRAEIEEMQQRLLDLEALVARLEAERDTPGQSPSGVSGALKLPSEKEMDEAFSFLERTLKRFKGLMEDLQQDSGRGIPL